jgi:DNA-directed RNA polymerase subunit M/transcription elongation factor TFIIS
MKDITQVTLYICDRCSHEWQPKKDIVPKMCPKCKSLLWNKGAKR